MNSEYKPISNLWKDSEGYRYFGTLKLSSKIKYDGDDFIPLWEWVNQLQQENKTLKNELKNKPDTEITLQDDKGNKFMLIQTERIDMQEELNKTIQKLFNNWNKLKEYIKQEPTLYFYNDKLPFEVIMVKIITKMQELEQESDSNDSN